MTARRTVERCQRRHAFLHIVMPPGALAGADRDAMAARLASPSSATTSATSRP
jgi:hypothetical protein